jgi:hypothetical protein
VTSLASPFSLTILHPDLKKESIWSPSSPSWCEIAADEVSHIIEEDISRTSTRNPDGHVRGCDADDHGHASVTQMQLRVARMYLAGGVLDDGAQVAHIMEWRSIRTCDWFLFLV